MKKTIALLLSALLLLGITAGCGARVEKVPAAETPAPTAAPAPTAQPTPKATAAPTAAPKPTATPAPTPAPTEEHVEETPPPAPETPEGPVSAEGSVLFEKDGLRVTADGLDMDAYEEDSPVVWLNIENAGSEDAFLGLEHGSVNGFMTDLYLMGVYEEDGEYYSYSYAYGQTIPAGGTCRAALAYNTWAAPGCDLSVPAEITMYFTLAEEEYSSYYYISAPVTVVTGEEAEETDLRSLGTVVADSDELLLVLGEQDYDDWYGPTLCLYAENRTDGFLGLMADTAEADGVYCDYIFGSTYMAPHTRSTRLIFFDGELAELPGFEDFSINYLLFTSDSYEDLGDGESLPLGPLTARYPPQEWGVYENGGYTLKVKPKYNHLVTVEIPEDDELGSLFRVYETASVEASDYEGAGFLFGISRIDEEQLHEWLCYDMSGVEVFAKEAEGNYFLFLTPTDVRFERATQEEFESGMEQWSELCAWSDTVRDRFGEENGLEYASYGNSEVDVAIARAAWMEGENVTLSTTEYGPVKLEGVDGTPYAEALLHCWFYWTDPEMTPDGEYVVLSFPDSDLRLDFFFAPGNYVRVISGDYETLLQASWYDDHVSSAAIMQGWYYAALEQAGLKEPDTSFDSFLGTWAETIAGRGFVTIEKSLAPGFVNISVSWPDSAAVRWNWELTARNEEGVLYYEDGYMEVREYDENGDSWINDSNWSESGWFSLNEDGELVWHDSYREEKGESTFKRVG